MLNWFYFGVWVVWAEQHAQYTAFILRTAMKKSNVTKLKSNQGLTVYSVYCAQCAFCDFWALRQTSNGTFGEKNGLGSYSEC